MPSSHDGASLRAPRPTLTRLATIVLTAALAVSGLLGVAPHASAAGAAGASTSSGRSTSAGTQSQQTTAAQRFNSKADRVLRVTRNHRGDWYQYGAAGPHRFDCSGLVMYVFQHALGKSLPHNAEAQMQRAHRITRAHLRRGDLVFQVSGGYAYHVGIYAGHGYMWDAPHSGARVHKHKMYNAHWRYGRLIRWN